MKATVYNQSTLFCENISVSELVHQFGSPLYVYSHKVLCDAYYSYQSAFSSLNPTICYAVKANDNLAILTLFRTLGAGADVVSGGELFKALEAGVSPDKIVFSGVGKSSEELEYALRKGIRMITLESIEEFNALSRIASIQKKKAKVSVRLNPNVEPKTHAYISTGLKESKFGLPLQESLALYQKIKSSPFVEAVGLSMHIGSQLTDLSPLAEAVENGLAVVRTLKTQGIKLKYFDVGGGVGIPYTRETTPIALSSYASILEKSLATESLELMLEPGRSLVAESGVLLTKVIYVKRHSGKTFVIVDAGMNDLIRPTLYQAYHEILPVRLSQGTPEKVDVVGPVCESGDYFAKGREMVVPHEGDILCIQDAGAYATVMASNYNVRGRVAEVLVKGDQVDMIRTRETFEDMIKRDRVPSWLVVT